MSAMEFLKAMRLVGGKKPNSGGHTDDKAQPLPEAAKDNTVDQSVKSTDLNTHNTELNDDDDDDDDDFITNEVKRRLKELRRNSFMALIPEEQSSPEDEEDEEELGETSSSESRGQDVERHQFWSGFDSFYDRYCERMLHFDGLIVQQLHEIGSHVPSVPLPRTASRKLASSLRCLSMKNLKEPEDEMEQLQQPECNPYHDLDSTYVSQLCLTWETLHSQYTQLNQRISCGPHSSASYSHCAQQFQQFQVLLQRFIENEPFEKGLRPETYARMRSSLPKFLQVPKVQGFDQKVITGDTSDIPVLTTDIIHIIESSILLFYQFLRTEKKKSKSGDERTIFGSHNQMATPVQQVQSSLEKKAMKLKELRKRKKSWKKNTWPVLQEDVELLLSIIDVKVCSRVLKMARISKEQLFWCEEKMKKIDLSNGKVQRDLSPLLFPC